MNRKKHKIPQKQKNISIIILLLIALLSAATGGVVAYLSASTGSLKNEFERAADPIVITKEDNSIEVKDSGYAVYLRAAVVVNWINNDHILAEIPKEGVDYTITLGDGWKEIGSFYYYKSAISSDTTTSPVVQIEEITNKKGYELEASVSAQIVQAVGTTDVENKAAVEDAWGVTAANLEAIDRE